MKKVSLVLLLVITSLFIGCSPTTFKQPEEEINTTETKTFQIGHITSNNEDDPYQVLCVNFADNVKEMSNGTITIEVIPNAQLGGERDMIEGMQLGTIEMALLTNVNVGSFEPKFLAFDLPFIFSSSEKAHEVLDGPVGREALDSLEDLNVVGLAWGEGGFRHMINDTRPINIPSDVKGMKFRSLENPLYIDTYKAIGTNPTPMAWTETFTGMQQGTIDGLDIPISVIYANRFFEVADYLSLTNHFYSPLMLTVNKNIWDTLTPDEQNILINAAKKAGVDERQFVRDSEQKMIDEMKAAGMTINSDVDYEAFKAIVQPVYENYKDKIGEDFYNKVMQATE